MFPSPKALCCDLSAASATQHPSTRIMLAALKFFLGQDDKEDDDGEGDDEEAPAPTAPTRGDVYKATSKVRLRGTGEDASALLFTMQPQSTMCRTQRVH